ncbi:MAG: hypothetical protein KKB29_02470 [Nanoarchaeota archaeon]|nr:hypothetical protein [Nanoarchaeota archaeon]
MSFRKNHSLKLFLITALFLLVLLPFVSSENVTVTRRSSGEVLVVNTDSAVTLDLKLFNSGPEATFELYNLLGFTMEPNNIYMSAGSTTNVELKLTPLGTINERGYYTMSYYIKRSDTEQEQHTLTFKIIELKDAFSIGAGYLDPQSTEVEVFIKNKENVEFGNASAKFTSPFFNFEKVFTLEPYETKTFDIPIDREILKGMTAGFYTITSEVTIGDEKASVEGVVKFMEKDIVTTTKSEFGFLINTQVIEKSNEGNVVQKTETVISKNVIPRLFTSFSPEPDMVERDGANVYYTWISEINPGEVIQIKVKTNWLFPFMIIFFLAIIVFITRKYTETSLVLRKRVSFVHAKGGEFALKVTVFISSKKYLERINIIDRLPPLVDVYERFGGEQPSKIDKKNKKIEWNFEKLEAGEMRTISYVIYSKVGIVGRFALPPATAIYEQEGNIQEAESNRAFFVTEQRVRKSENDGG